MNTSKRNLTLIALLAIVITATLPQISGVLALADPHPDRHDEDQEVMPSASSGVALADRLISDLMELDPREDTGFDSCTQLADSYRLGAPASDGTKRVVFVFVEPNDIGGTAADPRFDLPTACSNNNVYSVADRMYRSTMILMAREAQFWTNPFLAPRRIYTFAHTYPNNYMANYKSLYAGHYMRSRYTAAQFLAMNFDTKMANVISELKQAAYNNINYTYIAVLDARDTVNCGAAKGTGTRGTANAYALIVRTCPDSTGAPFTVRFGCATYGDHAILHETSHVLGANHINNNRDMMFGAPFGTVVVTDYVDLEIDHGANDYRSATYNNGGWTTTNGTSPNSAFPHCA